jgi:hypothetical protein
MDTYGNSCRRMILRKVPILPLRHPLNRAQGAEVASVAYGQKKAPEAWEPGPSRGGGATIQTWLIMVNKSLR